LKKNRLWKHLNHNKIWNKNLALYYGSAEIIGLLQNIHSRNCHIGNWLERELHVNNNFD